METIAEPGTVRGESGAVLGAEQGAMPVTAKDPEKVRAARIRINYALAGVLLNTGLTFDEIAKQCGAKNGQSIRLGLHKRGITKTRTKAMPVSEERFQPVLARAVTAGADAIRDRLAGQLGQSVESLDTVPVQYPDLASKGQGRAAVLKTLAETHKLLFGGSESTVLVFGVDQIAERALEPALDVSVTVQKQDE